MTDKTREEKLPLWARDELERLRGNVEDFKRQLDEVGGPTPTLVRIEHFERDDVCLPNDSRVNFGVRRESFECSWSEDYSALQVLGDLPLVVAPHSSNLVIIKARPDNVSW